ncbi:hypothetical protein PROFUN_16936 [Planoprotostelium fungivorum]|uniref:Uncharacterized protein n=1 Tax=Planoprotostelium fungivorum TaxID=1890364 RepID=A0A2P6MND2_9EUKA|nr:hypothetical protein PROFUN_16936 [Planoprotostelium fungivorum]
MQKQGPPGIEPGTCRTAAGCSTTELWTQDVCFDLIDVTYIAKHLSLSQTEGKLLLPIFCSDQRNPGVPRAKERSDGVGGWFNALDFSENV